MLFADRGNRAADKPPDPPDPVVAAGQPHDAAHAFGAGAAHFGEGDGGGRLVCGSHLGVEERASGTSSGEPTAR